MVNSNSIDLEDNPGITCVEGVWGMSYESLTPCFESGDYDGDGIINSEDDDDDNDGIPDSAEMDFDGDGISDLVDTDDNGHGSIDYFDSSPTLNPFNSSDALADFDSDGLTNIQEYELGTLLDFADSDGDGILDPDDPEPAPVPILDAINGMVDEQFKRCLLSDYEYRTVVTPVYSVHLDDVIYCAGWNIKSIEGISAFRSIETLALHINEIKDLSELENLTNLTSLLASSNEIEDISFIDKLTKLEVLSLTFNSIYDFSAIANLTNLTHLDIGL